MGDYTNSGFDKFLRRTGFFRPTAKEQTEDETSMHLPRLGKEQIARGKYQGQKLIIDWDRGEIHTSYAGRRMADFGSLEGIEEIQGFRLTDALGRLRFEVSTDRIYSAAAEVSVSAEAGVKTIQEAVNELVDKNPGQLGMVFVKSGLHTNNSDVYVPSGIHIIGEDPTSAVIQFNNGCGFKLGYSVEGVAGSTAFNNKIQNLTIQGTATGTGIALQAQSFNKLRVENVNFYLFGTNIKSTVGNFLNCYFRNTYSYTSETFISSATDIDSSEVMYTEAYTTGNAVYTAGEVISSSFVGNTFTTSGAAKALNFTSHCSDSHFRDNAITSETSGQTAVYFGGNFLKSFFVENEVVTEGKAIDSTTLTQTSVISNNFIDGSNAVALNLVDLNWSTLAGNICVLTSSGQGGVFVDGGFEASIFGNTFAGDASSGGIGMNFDNIDRSKITGNSASGFATGCDLDAGTDRVSLTGNTLYNNSVANLTDNSTNIASAGNITA